MSTSTSNVRVGVSGELFVAPTGTAAPTDADSPLNVAFKGLGFFSDDGVTEAFDRDTDDIVAWQNATTVRTVTSSAKVTYQGTLIETTVDVIQAALGVTVSQAGDYGTYSIDPGSTGGRKSWVLDVVDGTLQKRIYIAEGEVTELGETTYATGEPIGYNVTITAYGNVQVWDQALSS